LVAGGRVVDGLLGADGSDQPDGAENKADQADGPVKQAEHVA
jgi:hypothetical protein